MSSRLRLVTSLCLGGIGAGAIFLSRENVSSHILNQSTFVPYRLVEKHDISTSNAILTLECRDAQDAVQHLHRESSTWNVELKQPQLQIARAYTPLPPFRSDLDKSRIIRLLVKREHNGEMSSYLHSLALGSTIEIRGPKVDYVVPDDVSHILFLAGGTGIAPALQLAQALRNAADMTILWANRKREDCIGGQNTFAPMQSSWWRSLPLSYFGSDNPIRARHGNDFAKSAVVAQLQELISDESKNLEVEYLVDEEGTAITRSTLMRALRHQSASQMNSAGQKIIIVSGPEGFVKSLAGPKVWQNGNETQGPLGGLLSQIDLPGWKVIKL